MSEHSPTRRQAEAAAFASQELPPNVHPDFLYKVGCQALNNFFSQNNLELYADFHAQDPHNRPIYACDAPHHVEDIPVTSSESFLQWLQQADPELIDARQALLERYEAEFAHLDYDDLTELGRGTDSIAYDVDDTYVLRRSRSRHDGPYSVDERAIGLWSVRHIPQMEQVVAYSLAKGEIITTKAPGSQLTHIPEMIGYMDNTAYLHDAIDVFEQLHEAGLAIDNTESIFFHPREGFSFIDPRLLPESLAGQLSIFATAINDATQPETLTSRDDHITSAIGAAKGISVLRRLEKIINKRPWVDEEAIATLQHHSDELKDIITRHRENGFINTEPFSAESTVRAQELAALEGLIAEMLGKD